MKRISYFRLMTSAQRVLQVWQWKRGTLKRTYHFSGLLLLAFLLMSTPTFGQSGPEPGATSPLSPNQFTRFRDDEVFLLNLPAPTVQPYPGVSYNFIEYNGGQVNYVNDFNWDTESHQQFAASGRPFQPDKDHVVIAQRSGSDSSATSDVLLRFFPFGSAGNLHSEKDYTLVNAGLAPRAIDPRDATFSGSDFLDVAVGDLDLLLDSNGAYHDEVVVGWTTLESRGGNLAYVPHLAVLDYTDAEADPTTPVAVTEATASHWLNKSNIDSGSVYVNDNVMSITVGDFDGDGTKEIALAVIESSTSMWVSIFRYTNDGAGNRTLTESTPYQMTPASNQRFTATVDLAAGNADGNLTGQDELVVGTAVRDTGAGTTDNVQLALLQADSDLTLNLISSVPHTVAQNIYAPVGFARPKVQVVPGLFIFDPANGFGFNRRQFAVFYQTYAPVSLSPPNSPVGLITGEIYLYNGSSKTFGFNTSIGSPSLGDPAQRWAVAAGAYRGNKDTSDPRWSPMLTVWNDSAANNRVYFVYAWVPSDQQGYNVLPSILWQQNPYQTTFDTTIRPPLVATDWDGDSTILGAPIHITTSQSPRLDFLLQEPPKHAYYDNNPESLTYGQVVTVSRYDSFNVALVDSNKTAYQSTSTTSANIGAGVSLEASASATVSEGLNIGIAKTTVEEAGTIKGKVTGAFDDALQESDSQYQSRTIEITAKAANSDYMQGQFQIFDIWRYRVYGSTYSAAGLTNANGYYDVVFPGQVIDLFGDGSDYDWYQPAHENGNVLSYPQTLGTNPSDPYLPSDIGSYTSSGGTQKTEPLVPGAQHAFDNTSGSVKLEYTDQSIKGSSFSYNVSLTGNLDISGQVTATAKALGNGATVKGGAQVGFNGDFSFSQVDTANNTTNETTGITLNLPGGANTEAYFFYPVFYITADGTTKVAHAADVTSNAQGKFFWADLYSHKPDAALNLPLRFNPTFSTSNVQNGWEPNTSSTRKKMRGFFLTEPNLNPITNDYDFLAGPPTVGDQVRVAVQVYNYSTAQALSNLKVRFEAVPYTSSTNTEGSFTNCPVGTQLDGTRCILGETFVSLAPLAMTMATINWDTTGFGPVAPADTTDYRIYVVLDPDNTIDEIYETEDPNVTYPSVDSDGKPLPLPQGVDPGQNNEGWGVATVLAPEANQALVQSGFEPDIFLAKKSFAALRPNGKLKTTKVKTKLHKPLSLRVGVKADLPDRGYRWLLIYDGKPGKNSEVIAMKQVAGLDSERPRYVWVDWTPHTPGSHNLYAVVAERRDDPIPGNNVTKLEVVVNGPKSTTPQSSFSGKAQQVGSASDNGKVSFTGTLALNRLIDLSAATVTLDGLLQESGTGELVRGHAGASFLPLTLAASRGSTATSATFATPANTQPRVQLEVKQPDPKQAGLEFTLTVDHAAIPQGPVQCQSGDQARLTTSFLLDDHVHTPVVVTPTLPWRCSKSELETP